jgi:hypothetical protein
MLRPTPWAVHEQAGEIACGRRLALAWETGAGVVAGAADEETDGVLRWREGRGCVLGGQGLLEGQRDDVYGWKRALSGCGAGAG